MKISDVLPADAVLTELKPENKRKLLEDIAGWIASNYGLDKMNVFEAVWERENLGSTGYGNGVAFPHARINGLNRVITAFIRLPQAIDFEALDAKPVDLLAFMISPENSGNDYLQTLALFSKVLNNEKSCNAIRKAHTSHEIYVALQK